MPTSQHPSSPALCPVCGGYLSARPAHGKPCSCPPKIEPFNPSADTVDDDRIDAGPNGGEELHVQVKRCCQCGKDLTGHRRFKDSLGYWCKDCHRKDKARSKEAESRCPDCGRMVRITALTVYKDRSICPTCLKEAQIVDKRKKNQQIAEEEHKAHERRRLYVLAGIAGFLVLLIVLKQFGAF